MTRVSSLATFAWSGAQMKANVERLIVEGEVLGVTLERVQVEDALALVGSQAFQQLVAYGCEDLGEALVDRLVPDLLHAREHTARHAGPLRRGGGAQARGARAAGAATAPADARRVRRAGACAPAGTSAPPRDRSGPRPVARPLRAARIRQDDARPDRRQHDRRRVRGALRGVGDRLAGAGGA